MKITIFIGGLSGGGAERVTCNLANHLIKKGHMVEIITISEDEPDYNLSGRIKRIPLLRKDERTNIVRGLVLRVQRLRKYMKQSDTECYLTLLPVAVILILMLHRNTDIPIIVSERNDPARNTWLLRSLIARYARHGTAYVFQTEEAKKWYAPYIKGKKTEIIPNAINEDFIKPIERKMNRDKTIVAVGRLSKQKNFGLLIDAFGIIRNIFSDYKLIIFGEGPLRGILESKIEKSGLKKCISLPGRVKNIGEHIVNASAFVLSSDYEGMPNALMEAMALGVPCISTDCPVGGPGSLIENGVNGLLVPVNDRDALAKAIKRMLGSPDEAECMGEKARKIILASCNPKIIYSRWERFIMDTAKKEDVIC